MYTAVQHGSGFSRRGIVRFYRARFQIEVLFRDAKGSMGLKDVRRVT